MADTVLKETLELNLLANTREIAKVIAGLEKKGLNLDLDKRALREFDKFARDAQDRAVGLVTRATDAAMRINFSAITQFQKQWEEANNKVKAIQGALAKAQNDEEKKHLVAGLNLKLKAEKELLTKATKRLDIERAKVDEFYEMRKQAQEDLAKRESLSFFKKRAEDLKLVGDLGDAMTGWGDVGGASGGLQKILETLGKSATAKSVKSVQQDASGLSKDLGSMLGKLGPALMTVAGIVGGFAAVIKVLVDVDAQLSDLNRSILDNVSVSDLMVGNTKNLATELKIVRDAAVDWRNNMTWGTTAKDQIQILNAFTQAGITFRAIAGNLADASDKMQAYQKATQGALVYSKLLGVSATEVAQNMADMMEELGLSLKGVQTRFGAIYEAAQLSGFSAKRFYGIVLEATSGMSMYNVRLSEAAGLLVKLGRILGKKVAPEFLKNITDMFKSDDIPTRYKKILLAGRGRTAKIFAQSAENTANDFLSKFKDQFKVVGGAFQAAEIQVPGLGDLADPKKRAAASGNIVKALMKLTPEKQTKLIAQVGVHNSAMARQLENLVQISKASGGNLSQMALHMDSLDLGGKMQFALTQASSIFKKPIHELGAIQTAAFANMTGMGMEQIKQLRRVSRRMTGNFKTLEEQAGIMRQIKDDPKQKEKLARLVALQAKNAEAMGAMVQITKDGQVRIVAATVDSNKNLVISNDKSLKTQQDYVQTQGEIFKQAAKDGAPEHIKLARMTAQKTTDMTHILKAGVQYWLEQIHKGIMHIGSWFGGLDSTEKARKAEVQQTLGGRLSGFRNMREAAGLKLSGLQMELAGAKSPEQTTALRDKIKKVEEDIKKLDMQSKRVTATMGAVQGFDKGKWGWFRHRTKDEIIKMSEQSIAPKFLQESGMGMELGTRTAAAQSAALASKQAAINAANRGGAAARHGKIYTATLSDAEKADIQAKQGQQMLEEMRKQGYKDMQTMNYLTKDQKTILEKTNPERTGKEVVKALKVDQRNEFIEALQRAGFNPSEMERQRYISSGTLSPKLLGLMGARKNITGYKEPMNFWESISRFGGVGAASNIFAGMAPKSNDFLLRLSNNGRVSVLNRFDPADSLAVVGAKPGGGLSAAATTRSGKVPVVINIYGNEERAYAVVKRVLKQTGVI